MVLSSCFKEEEGIEPVDRGGAIVKTISTGENGDYSDQVFYDIENNVEVKVVDRASWDLGFETTPTGVVVRLNTSNTMQASKTGETDFSAISDITTFPLDYYWDRSDGSVDSVALKDWIIGGVPTNEVFILDLGETVDLVQRGFRKLQILGVTATDFTIRYANIDGSNEQTRVIPKEVNKNQTCFSFSGAGSVVNIEPDANDWDLLFTQYLHTFYDSDPEIYYSVHGVLLNPTKTKGARVFDKEFSEISISDVAVYPLTNKLDVIGYEWKLFDFATELYTVDITKNYIIQDRSGAYYKMRFTDFYNTGGVKGNPQFELVKL